MLAKTLKLVFTLLIFGPVTLSSLIKPSIIQHPGGVEITAGNGLVNLPPLINPMVVTSYSFQLLSDNIGFKLAVNYACGVSIAMESFLNRSLLASIPPLTPMPLPVVGGILDEGSRDGVGDVAKYINPIVLVGSTCINLGGICGKYNVNQNAMSVA